MIRKKKKKKKRSQTLDAIKSHNAIKKDKEQEKIEESKHQIQLAYFIPLFKGEKKKGKKQKKIDSLMDY